MNPTRLSITAPAKVNLGLEILGKRTDGYHEIRSILAMVDLADILTFEIDDQASIGSITLDGMDLSPESNLIARAHRLIHDMHELPGLHVTIDKRIPMAAGLGGASSDAATTLLALATFANNQSLSDALPTLASRIGSDVPFFLGAPVTIASGTGTEMDPLPTTSGTMVLVTPTVEISNKTGTLYGLLGAEDFTDGSTIEIQAQRIRNHEKLDSSKLINAFSRPLFQIAPVTRQVQDAMLLAGAPFVAISGAGPTCYTIVDSTVAARDIAEDVRHRIGQTATVHVCGFRSSSPSVELGN